MSPARKNAAGWAQTRSLWACGVAAAVAFAFFAGAGWPYYRLAAEARPFHPDHSALRPSGSWGLTLGMAGTALMLANLGYLVRKRWVGARFPGSLRSWMSFHVLTGLVGPACIVLHSAFLPRSPLGALAFFAMMIVVLAGLVGRWIYAWVPRSLEGHELALDDARKLLVRRQKELEGLGLRIALPSPAPPAGGHRKDLISAFSSLIQGDRKARLEFKDLRRVVQASAELRTRAGAILPLARRISKERGMVERYRDLKQLLGAWRFLHRWLAIVLLLLAAFHIGIAIRYGELWVLTEGGVHAP